VAESEDKGRCVNCGFLGKQVKPGQRAITPSYYEIDQHGRDTGRVWSQHQDLLTAEVSTEPVCFKQVVSIREEIEAAKEKAADQYEAARQTFERTRHCGSWYQYIPGFGPKEHAERLEKEQWEENRMKFELEIEKQRQDFELKLFEISQKIQENSRKIASRSFWFNLFFTFVIIVLTLVQIFLAMDWGRATFRQWVDQLGNLLIQKMSGG
jgi:hypothetical protein